MENMNKMKKIIFHYKNIDIHKTPLPHSPNPGFKLVFRTIPYLKFWALRGNVNTRRMLQPDMGYIFHIKNQ